MISIECALHKVIGYAFAKHGSLFTKVFMCWRDVVPVGVKDRSCPYKLSIIDSKTRVLYAHAYGSDVSLILNYGAREIIENMNLRIGAFVAHKLLVKNVGF